jgi:tRNA(Ile)-lysidine synthase
MILKTLEIFLSANPHQKNHCIAYSGGVDSHVLLVALAQLKQQYNLQLSAIHVNHNISPQAKVWAEHCQQVCHALNIPIKILNVTVENNAKEGLEARARKKRYEAINECLSKETFLMTGHHQDDQAETVLLQLCRGTGLTGLTGMSPLKKMLGFMLARPLLNVSRAEIEVFAQEYALDYIQDDSNADESLRRNYVRQTIIPQLQTRWPAVMPAMAQAAEHCAESKILLDEFIAELLPQVVNEGRLSLERLLHYSEPRQRALLRMWLSTHRLSMPSTAKLNCLMTEVIHASLDRCPMIHWQGHAIRRFKNDLYITDYPLPSYKNFELSVAWNDSGPLVLPHNSEPILLADFGVPLAELENKKLSIRFRRGGERLFLNGQHHSLKKLFQEWGVPEWERSRIPLLFVDGELKALKTKSGPKSAF